MVMSLWPAAAAMTTAKTESPPALGGLNMSIRTTHAVLVILDISGYTRFIHQRVVSLEHAEAIISELLETVIDTASHPLTVNKLEGDAALLYAETGEDRAAAMRSVYDQVARFFSAFSCRVDAIRESRSHCGCSACANVEMLRLKAIVHAGEIVVKQVRQFDEIAGEAVILLHRLLKNDIPSHDYVVLTDTARQLLGALPTPMAMIEQSIAGMSACRVHWCESAQLPRPDPIATEHAERHQSQSVLPRHRRFHHLPFDLTARVLRWWKAHSQAEP